MNILYGLFVDPWVQMGQAPDLLVQTLWEGLVSGVLYALIALGFVLCFNVSGVVNMAQGEFVMIGLMGDPDPKTGKQKPLLRAYSS